MTFRFHAPATCSNLYAFPAPFLPKASAGKTTGVSRRKEKKKIKKSIITEALKTWLGLITLRFSLNGLTFLGPVQKTHMHMHTPMHTCMYVHTQTHAQKHMYNCRPAQTPCVQVYNPYTECLNKTLMFITTQ